MAPIADMPGTWATDFDWRHDRRRPGARRAQGDTVRRRNGQKDEEGEGYGE